MRFDEVELEAVPLPPLIDPESAPRWKRMLALLADVSLFVALGLSPLLPQAYGWPEVAALVGFVVVVSYYYFVGAWMLWGKTIGGAIFDVRTNTVAMSMRD